MLDQATIAVIKSTIPLLESAGPDLTRHSVSYTHLNPHKKPPAPVLARETRNQDPNQLRLFEQSDQYS